MRDIDRLVDGELSPEDRRNLLKRLDNETDGWKRCALAFLEDQAFKESFKPPRQIVGWVSDAQPTGMSTAASVGYASLTHPTSPRLPKSQARHRLLTAAAVLLAFTLGWSAKPKPAVEVVQKPVSTAPAVETPAAPVSASTVAQQPVERRPDPKSDNVTVLNRAGYRVERLKRFVAIDKTNGRNIAVPVSEYAIQYIGNQTY